MLPVQRRLDAWPCLPQAGDGRHALGSAGATAGTSFLIPTLSDRAPRARWGRDRVACARRALSSCGYARGCGQSACGMRRCDRVQGAFVRSGWHGTLLRRPACRAHGLGSLHLQLGLWRRRAASCDTLTPGPAPVVVHAALRMMPCLGLGLRCPSMPNALESRRLCR